MLFVLSRKDRLPVLSWTVYVYCLILVLVVLGMEILRCVSSSALSQAKTIGSGPRCRQEPVHNAVLGSRHHASSCSRPGVFWLH